MVELQSYTEVYLAKSWKWLNDPEIKFLTNTPNFSLQEQKKWFSTLAGRQDYKVWGVSFDNQPIGVFGIKNIDYTKMDGEYFGFIGEKEFWGKGIGTLALQKLLDIARNTVMLKTVYLNVIRENKVAISFYEKFGFQEIYSDDKNITLQLTIK